MKRILSLIAASLSVFFYIGCNSGNQSDNTSNSTAAKKDSAKQDNGIGKFTNIRLTHPLDDSMISRGKLLYDSRCISCHKLTDEKLVGPGWKGVTDRRTPEWVMNFITNTNIMLDSDLVAQQLVVTCVTRMPSQNLSDDQARAILEFMRKNDGKN
jgi:mono/diheme cytochrome c family protein